MVYAYDNWVQLPTKDLYDTQVMAMAINAAKDMYEKGQLEMKDFRKEYGDFMTPIAADQAWYDLNVTGKIRDTINALYTLGIDPLRNALGRAMISLVINSMPYGDIAKLRMSAANALEYLKARQKLELEGKYNPLMELYAGIGLGLFSTVDNGVWDRMSPVPYQNMAEFSKAYFDNIQPFQRARTKDGISYSAQEINIDDLHNIADQHFNDLVQTPQGRLMYLMYKDQLGSDEAAKKAFNDAVVSGNTDRLRYSDDFDRRKKEEESLALQRDSNRLAWAKHNWDMQKDAEELEIKRIAAENKGRGSRGQNKEGNSEYLQDQFDRGLQYYTYGNAGALPDAKLIEKNSKDVASVAFSKTKGLRYSKDENSWNIQKDSYLKANTAKGILSPDALTNGLGREIDKSRSDCVWLDSGDINKLYSGDEIVSTTFGGARIENGKKVLKRTDRSKLNEYGSDKLKMQFTDETYTAPISDPNGTGRMKQFQKVKVYRTYGNGNKNNKEEEVGEYWFQVQQGVIVTSGVIDGKRAWSQFDSSWDDNDAGEMEVINSRMRKYFGTGKTSYGEVKEE